MGTFPKSLYSSAYFSCIKDHGGVLENTMNIVTFEEIKSVKKLTEIGIFCSNDEKNPTHFISMKIENKKISIWKVSLKGRCLDINLYS